MGQESFDDDAENFFSPKINRTLDIQDLRHFGHAVRCPDGPSVLYDSFIISPTSNKMKKSELILAQKSLAARQVKLESQVKLYNSNSDHPFPF